ncbi:MAG: thioredoxin domain-containing protein, partial [Patescibacteria group bacterium]
MDNSKESKKDRDLRKNQIRSGNRLVVGAVLVIVALAVVFGLVRYSAQNDGNDDNVIVGVAEITATDHVRGATTSPKAILVEYSDFQCPACAATEPFLAEIVSEYGDRGLALVYRHFPLEQHNKALLASQFAEAAIIQGKFWPIHDLIFSNQDSWSLLSVSETKTVFLDYAKQVGLDLIRLEADLNSKEVDDKIKADLASANQAGV